ncbi:hypothetical protein UA08_08000 [Talaromyces atroroseus]|uniref:Uncharacterized protein n=1 Tax=Talaromyces atroroseus TaxID=1441469 RepID=A0A225APG4_TALAT|nr:hypothetical protein UA08_08000 [Talaromyces atroroseus]OKL56856.1 hypothetical protein UA08_08000 [Talaromyces atroroseus]
MNRGGGQGSSSSQILDIQFLVDAPEKAAPGLLPWSLFAEVIYRGDEDLQGLDWSIEYKLCDASGGYEASFQSFSQQVGSPSLYLPIPVTKRVEPGKYLVKASIWLMDGQDVYVDKVEAQSHIFEIVKGFDNRTLKLGSAEKQCLESKLFNMNPQMRPHYQPYW